jgi:hypothetical protein
MSVDLKLGTGSREPPVPHELFAMPPGFPALSPYEAAPDGQRFLITVIENRPEPLNVIVNWPSLLKKEALTK